MNEKQDVARKETNNTTLAYIHGRFFSYFRGVFWSNESDASVLLFCFSAGDSLRKKGKRWRHEGRRNCSRRALVTDWSTAKERTGCDWPGPALTEGGRAKEKKKKKNTHPAAGFSIRENGDGAREMDETREKERNRRGAPAHKPVRRPFLSASLSYVKKKWRKKLLLSRLVPPALPAEQKKKGRDRKKDSFPYIFFTSFFFFFSSTEHQQDTQPSLARPPPMENPLNFYKDIVRPHRRKKNWIIYTKRTILWTLTYLCEMANYAMHFLWVFCWV